MSSKVGTTGEGAPALTGGCLCEALRYEVSRPLVDAGYCHCRICQRAHGAPVVAWLTAPRDAFRYVRGAPAIYASSPAYQREFCTGCGSQLVFRRQSDAALIDIAIATLDTPEAVAPEYHIWRASRIPWFETVDTLPRHDDSGPDWT